MGNQTKLVENCGGTILEENYSYDDANQLGQITRSDGSVTALAHDNNGNMVSLVTQLSGAVTENLAYVYDFDDRLVRVENRALWPELVVEYNPLWEWIKQEKQPDEFAE